MLAVLVGTVSFIAILWHRAVNDAKRKVRDRDREIRRLKNENRRLKAEIVDLKTRLYEVQSRYVKDVLQEVERQRAELLELGYTNPRYPEFSDGIDDLFSVVPDDDSDEPDSPDPSDA